MPRLSLYKSEKGPDFKFIDRAVGEQFQIGGTDVYIHKYLGPQDPADGESTPSTPTNIKNIPELGIQDLLFMENRDRKYSEDVYIARGIYTLSDIDFNLSQFGLFLQNDTIMLMFHLRGIVDILGRKIMSGDVIELPHLKDEYALDESDAALKRFYVVQDVSRPSVGYSPTWYPHLVRCKCVPIVNSQEFEEILGKPLLDADGNDTGQTLKDLMSTYQLSLEINDQILEQANLDAPLSGYDTRSLYVLPLREDGLLDVADASNINEDASIDNASFDASIVLQSPNRNIYVGYLTGDSIPPNGAPYSYGDTFPVMPVFGEFYLRTDYMPNRLFRFDGKRWTKFEDNVRMTLNNYGNTDTDKPVRQTQKTGFINNINTATIAGKIVEERQALSKALRPKADN